MSAAATPGDIRLTIPAGYCARWLSDPAAQEQVERWTADSPERTVYHAPSYIEFAREQNGRADLLWLTRAGAPVLGLPVHPTGRAHIASGYSGVLLTSHVGAAAARRGVEALVALLAANRHLGFHAIQSVQAPAYDEPARLADLACLLAAHGLHGPPLYSRVLALEPLDLERPGEPCLDEPLLLEHGMRPYQAALRNQIRQALRHGLRATCALPGGDRAVYDEFTALHTESWRRTGLTPHPLDYWTALGRAVVAGGGRDLVVFARDPDDTPVAAVSCHLRGERALYWAGASSERGLARRANPLCLHAAIQACRQLGVRHFELGRFHARERSQKERAVTRYKTQFGGELVRIASFRTHPSPVALVLRHTRPAHYFPAAEIRSRRPRRRGSRHGASATSERGATSPR